MYRRACRKRRANSIDELHTSLAVRAKIGDGGPAPEARSSDDISSDEKDAGSDEKDAGSDEKDSGSDEKDSGSDEEDSDIPPQNDYYPDDRDEFPYLLETRSSDDSCDSSDDGSSSDGASLDLDNESSASDSEVSDPESSHSEVSDPESSQLDGDKESADEEDRAAESFAQDEEEYDNDPECLENSENDLDDEAAEDEDEEATFQMMIHDSLKDLAEAQGYVLCLAHVYTKLGLCDVAMQNKLNKFKVTARKLGVMEQQMCTRVVADSDNERAEQKMTGSEWNNEDIWKYMDRFAEQLWKFVEKYSGHTPAVKNNLVILKALDDVDGIDVEGNDGIPEKYHQQIFLEKYGDTLDFAESETLLEIIREECFMLTEFRSDFLDPDALVFERAELDAVADRYDSLSEAWSKTLEKFKHKYPSIWRKLSRKDGRFDNYRALEAIRTDQQRSDLIISRRRMRQLVHEVFQDIQTQNGERFQLHRVPATKIDSSALAALHTAAEDYLTTVLEAAGCLSVGIADRRFIVPKDLQSVLRNL